MTRSYRAVLKALTAVIFLAVLILFLPAHKALAAGDPIKGEVLASKIQGESSVDCSGDTTIIMDEDLTESNGYSFNMINANGHDLTIKNGKGGRHTLTVAGKGALIEAGNIKIEGIDLVLTQSEAYGDPVVSADKSIDFRDVNLTANTKISDAYDVFKAKRDILIDHCSKFSVNSDGGGFVLHAVGQYVDGKLQGGKVEINSTELSVDAKAGIRGGCAVKMSDVSGKIKCQSMQGIASDVGGLTLTGCRMDIDSGTAIVMDGDKSIEIQKSALSMVTGAYDAIISLEEVKIQDCDIWMRSGSYGIEAEGITVKNSKLDIDAMNEQALRSDGSYGVVLDNVTGTIKSYSKNGIYSEEGVTISGCDLTLKGGKAALDWQNGKCIISSNNWIKTPADYKFIEVPIDGKTHHQLANSDGTAATEAVIAKKRITDSVCSISVADGTYTGSKIEPVPVVKWNGTGLKKDTDFKVTFTNNINAGTATAKIIGTGSYAGSTTKTFKIGKADISKASAATIADQTCTGSAIKPSLKLTFGGKTLSADKDYSVSFKDNVNVGTAAVTITGKGNFTGTKTVSFKIQAKPEEEKPSSDPEDQKDTEAAGGEKETDPAEEKEDSGAEKEQKAADGTKVGKGASAKTAEKAILAMKKDEAPKGSVFGILQLKAAAKSRKSLKLTWKAVDGAKTYVIYGNACGKNNKTGKYTKMERLKATGKKGWTFKKVAGKAVETNKYYKFLVVALDKNENVITTSKTVHITPKGKKYGNDKKVETAAEKKKNKITLKENEKFKLKAKPVPKSKKLKVKRHRKIVYESTDKQIAKVSKKGVITAVKEGKCYVYAYAQDGIAAKIKVKVKAAE